MAIVARGMGVPGIGEDLPHTQVLDKQVGSDHAHASVLYTTSRDQEKRSRTASTGDWPTARRHAPAPWPRRNVYS